MTPDPTLSRLIDALVAADTAHTAAVERQTDVIAAYEHRGYMQQAVQRAADADKVLQAAKDRVCAYLLSQREEEK